MFEPDILTRLARALQRSEAPCLLTGADAVSYYGAPRRSGDKDAMVMTDSPEKLQRIVNELRLESFTISKLEVGHNTTFDSGFRIDIKVKSEAEESRRIRLDRDLWLNITTPENLLLMKLEFWNGKSFESNDVQDIMKILARQGRSLDTSRLRNEALKRRTYAKLSKIEHYLSWARREPQESEKVTVERNFGFGRILTRFPIDLRHRDSGRKAGYE